MTEKIYMIAECGINYAFGKDKKEFINNAKRLIDMSKSAGADCVKFQKRNPDLAVPEDQKNKEKIVPWREEPTTYLQYKKDIEFTEEEYKIINDYCIKKNIRWTASVWDIDSLEFLKHYGVPFVKIPSALITNVELLKACRYSGIPVYISTGMSTEEEIDTAVKLLGKSLKVMFHCNSSYPAKDNELNLSYITMLKINYPHIQIGYSGHEEGISACIVAKAMGASIFERHVTLSRSNWGTDQSASIVFDQLYRLTRDLNKVDTWLGLPVKIVFDSEKSIKKKLRGV